MACVKEEKFSLPPIKLANKMDISNKKLTISGWWWLSPLQQYSTIIAIADNETSSYRRVMHLIQYQTSYAFLYEQRYDNNQKILLPFGNNQAILNYFIQQWIFITASVDLDQQYLSLHLYSPQSSDYTVWSKLTGANVYTSFSASHYISIGIDCITYDIYPGCGNVADVRLYPNFALADQSQIDYKILIKHETSIQIYYPFSSTSDYLQDKTNSRFIYNVGTNTAQVDTSGLLMNSGQFILLPEISQMKGEILINFWIQLPATAGTFIILKSKELGSNIPQIILSMIPGNPTDYQILNINYKGTNTQLTSLNQFLLNSWYNIMMSCHQLLGNQYKMQCNFVQFSNTNTMASQNITQTDNYGRFKRLQYTLGDSTNTASFRMKNFLIGDGSMYNLKDSISNCANNCELYLSNGYCLVCSTGYVLDLNQGNSCILSSSCSIIDNDINICKTQQTVCSGQGESQIYQNFYKIPTCNTCMDQFYMISNDCQSCNAGCLQCSDLSSCVSCTNGRTGANCDCASGYYDDKKSSECILKSSTYKVPSYVKYVKLDKTDFTTNQCGTNMPAVPGNEVLIPQNTLQSAASKKLSFTFWSYVDQHANLWVHHFNMHRNPITHWSRILTVHQAIDVSPYYMRIQTTLNEPVRQVVDWDCYLGTHHWVWVFVSLDISASSSLSSVIYRPDNAQWNYNRQPQTFYTDFSSYTDLQAHFGTLAPTQPLDCTMLGKMSTAFYYQGISAGEIQLDYFTLYQMMQYPDIPIMSWKITQSYSQVNTISDEFSTSTITKPTPSSNSATFQEFKGIIISGAQYVQLSLFDTYDFTIHYWWYREFQYNDNTNLIVYSRQSQEITLESLSHHPKLGKKAYSLQICIYTLCVWDQNDILTGRWNFVAANFHTDFYKYIIIIQSFVNSKHSTHTVYNGYTGTTTNIQITLGNTNNTSPYEFWIKDFGIDQGGALLNYDNGGYSASSLPYCVLKAYKSSLNSGTGYCLLCEWGYYVNNGTCSQSKRYCNSVGQDCVYTCPNGQVFDSYLPSYTCVTTCQLALYYFIDTSKLICVSPCPNNYYGDPSTQQCVLNCPSGFYPNLKTKICEQTVIPCANKVVYLEKYIRGMPCQSQEILQQDTANILSNRIDITKKKLTITGWWLLQSTQNTNTIFSIQESEQLNQYKRLLAIHYKYQSNAIFIQQLASACPNAAVGGGLNLTNVINEQNQTFFNFFFNQWIFIVVSIDLDLSFYTVQLYSQAAGIHRPWIKQTTANCYTGFNANQYINYGINQLSTANNLYPGCGLTKAVRLYSDFAYSQQYQIPTQLLVREEAYVRIYYGMSTPGQTIMLIDQSGNNNHANSIGDVNVDPVWDTGNKGVKFTANKYMILPEIVQSSNGYLISFWVKTPSTLQSFKIVQLVKQFENIKEAVLQIAPDATNTYGVFSIQAISSSSLITNQFTSLHQLAISSWYNILTSCSLTLASELICNITSSSNGINFLFDSSSFLNSQRSKRIRYILGDQSNTGNSFTLRELIIADGSIYSYKNNIEDCVANCQLFLTSGVCILCSTGYVQSGGSCIAQGSCTTKDTEVNICASQAAMCAYQLFQLPTCTNCIDFYYKNITTCVPCPFGCQQCSSNTVCTLCFGNRIGTNCQCPVQYFDGLFYPECIFKAQSKIPPYVKYLGLQQSSFTTISCATNPANPVNQYDSVLSASSISTTGSNKISFSLWVYLTNLGTTNWVHALYMHRQPISDTQRILDLSFNSNSNSINIKSKNALNEIFLTISSNPNLKWLWFLISSDATSQTMSFIIYSPTDKTWVYRSLTSSPWSQLDFSDIQVHLGTQHPVGAADCTMSGNLATVFFYQGIVATDIGMDYSILNQMATQPDLPIAQWAVTVATLSNQVIQDIYSSATLQRGTTSNEDVNYDPTFHILKGIVFSKQNSANVQLFSATDFTVHYWFYKQQVNANVITYISKNNSQLVQLIKHIASLQDKSYFLQVCLFDFCAMDQTILLPIAKWNFIAVAVHFDYVSSYTINIFINTKHNSYTIDNQALSITMTSINLGHSSNDHSDKFFIKDFGIDMGGALLTLDTGGITSSGTEVLPHCLLRAYKSGLSAGNQYCLYCEWGYNISNGTCVQGYNYCNEQQSDCNATCPVGSGLFLDSVIYDCVANCTTGYFADPTTFKCVQICPAPLYYGNSFTATCVLVCPIPYYGDPISRMCVFDCPTNYFGDESSHLCTSPCPNNQFGNPSSKICVNNCPINLFGDVVSHICSTTCPSGYYGDSLTSLCIQSCPDGYFKDSTSSKCVIKCPNSFFADTPTKTCSTTCSASLLADQLTNQCVSQCPFGYFGDLITTKCVATCPNNYFGDAASATCLNKCPSGFFGDPTTIQCASSCPTIYFKDTLTSLCTSVCSSTQFSDPLSKKCVTTCPNSLYGDTIAKQCVSTCPNGYFASTLNQQCVSTCPNNLFGDENSGSCVNKCPKGLIGDLSIKKCVMSCSSNTYQDISLNVCVTSCPSGLFGDPLTKTCIKSCQTSNLYSDTLLGLCVMTCSGSQFGDTQTFQCVSTCATDYFGETIKKQCVKSCLGGFFGDTVSKQCVAACPTGYFGDTFTLKCSATCSNGQFGDSLTKQCAFTCSGNQFGDVLQNQCIATCPTGYFGNTINKLCVTSCPMTRFGDPSTVKCEQKCSNGYFGDSDTGLCVVTCPATYFGDPSINRCVLVCSSNSYADASSGLCVTTCPTNTFGDQLTKLCVSACVAPFFGDIVTIKCVRKCSDGYFGESQSNKCVTNCIDNLYGDTIINLCVSQCSSGQFINLLAMQCVTTCPAGLFGDYSIMKCVTNCTLGQYGDPSTSKCVSTCPSTYYADSTVSQKCVLQCPAGQFGDALTHKCVNVCSSGQFGDSTLQICVKTCPLTQFGDSSTWKCVGICPDGTFGDNLSQKCNTICPANYFADPSTKTCVQNCPSTLYADQQEGKCLQNCSTFGYYGDPVLHQCVTKCSVDYFGEPINFKCVQTCPPGYNQDFINNKCVITCPSNLFGDPTTLQCGAACPTDYYKDKTTWMCVVRCPKNYFSIESTKECTLYCPTGSFGDPKTSKCVEHCPSGYFGNVITIVGQQEALRLCEQCDASCNQCTASTNFFCVQCADSYYQKVHTNSSKQCLPCHSLCTQCFGQTQFNCTACQPLTILYNQGCTQKCLEFPLMYADPYNLQCKSCNPICQSCSGPTQFECIQCINGYFLSNFICQECLSPCIFCYGPEDNQCYSCVAGYYFQQPSTCIVCPDVCLTCTDSLTCQSCKTNRGSQLCDCSLLPNSIDYYPRSLWCGTCQVSVLSIIFSTDWTQIQIDFGFEITLINQQQPEIPSQNLCIYLFPPAIISKFGTSPTCNLKQTTKDQIIIHLSDSATIRLNEVIQFNQQTITKKICDGGGSGSATSFSFYDQNITMSSAQPNPFSLEIQSANTTYQKCEEILLKIGNIQNDGSQGIKYLNWSLTDITPLDRATRTAITEIINEANHNQIKNIILHSNLLQNQTNYTFKIYCENFFNQNTTAEINITIYIAEQQQYCLECHNVTQNFICPKCQIGVIHQENLCTLSCIEFQGTYPDILAKKCKTCDPMCISCTGSSDKDCTICTNKYYLEGQDCLDCNIACYTCSGPQPYQCSACNEGYYYEPESQCLACPAVCKSCVNLDNCTSCNFNRVGQNCNCPPNEGIPYVFTNWCGTCQLAVVSVYFSSDWQTITIDFGDAIVLTTSSDQEAPSNQKCNDMFPPTIYSKLGNTANCSLITIKRDKIVIQLDSSASILLGQEFILNPNAISRKDCSSSQKTYETMINSILQSNKEVFEFKIAIIGPNYRPTVCEQITIQMDKIENDGLRGLKNLTWSLSSILPSNPANQASVEAILASANQNKITKITFAAQTFLQNTEYIFSLLGYNWFDQNYTAFFTLTTSYSEGIQLQLDNSSDQSLYPRFQNITLKVFFKHLICQNDGTFLQIFDSVKYQWQQLEQEHNYSLGINETLDQSNPIINYSEIVIPSYTAEVLNLYKVKFTVLLINVNVSESIIINLNISQAALQASIIGGSKVASISQQFNLSGKAVDRDVNPNYPDQYEGMNFTWECQDLNTLSSCFDIKGNLINLEQNSLEQRFKKKTFLPYKSYKFIFTAIKGQRIKSAEAIVMFIEYDLPQLAVDVPAQYLDNRINLHDQIYLTMQYSNKYNPDTLFYSAVMIYDYEEVAIMIFDFLQVRFRIWDFFTNFTQSNIDLIVRFSIYNPLFIMPSQLMIPLKVNTVPIDCILNINPSIGDSLLTNFQITVSGCQDQDMPLSYQFFVYMSIQEQQEELLNYLTIKRNQLNDYFSQPTITTQLPQGYQDFSMKLVIMASVKDSFGGIANITQNVTVNKNVFVVNNDQVNYLQTLKSIFTQTQNIGMDIDTQMRLISLIVIDYTNSGILAPTSSEFNALKMQILDKLYLIKQQIQGTNSTWDQQITRLIGIIMKNSTALISSISQADAEKQLNNMGDIVSNVGNQLNNMPLDGSQSEKASKLDTLLINCAQAVDGMLLGFNNNSANTQSQNDTNNKNQQMINMTQEISKLMVLNALPNENPKLYLGQTLKIKSQVITPKHLSGYLGSNTQDWAESSQEEEKTEINFTLQMFNVAFKSYTQNPYANDTSFPYQNKTFKVIDPGIYQGNSTTKINITQPITHVFTIKQESNNSTTNSTLLRKNRQLDQTTKNTTFKCISLGVNKQWSAEQCEKLEQKQPDGTMTVKCICKDLSVATIGEDIVNIFADNKNIKLILSEEGLSNLQNIEFYKYAIFYIGSVMTLLWFYLIYKGIQIDKLNNTISQINIVEKPTKQINNIDKLTNQINETAKPQLEQQQSIKLENNEPIKQSEQQQGLKKLRRKRMSTINEDQININVAQQKNTSLNANVQSERQSLQNMDPKSQQDNNIDNLIDELQKIDQNEQIQNLPNKNLNMQNEFQLKQSDLQSKDINNDKNNMESDQQLIQEKNEDESLNQKQINLPIQYSKQTSSQPLKEIDEKTEYEKQVDPQMQQQNNISPINFIAGVMTYHEFFSIFSLNEPSISRPVRFTLYYIKTIYLMAMTIVFSETLNPIQTIALSAISGIAYSIIASLIKLLLKISIFLKIIGVLVSSGICFVCWYSTLVVTATKSPEESNFWSIQFFGTLFTDVIIIQMLVGTSKYSIFLLLIKRNFGLQGFIKKLSEIIIKILMNQKLKSAFNRLDQL